MDASAPATFASSPNLASVAQRRAIEHRVGPLLIIAGPSSGKTFTLDERVVYLIYVEGAAPQSPLVLRFTEKAAAELANRVSIRLLQLSAWVNLKEMYLGIGRSCLARSREVGAGYRRTGALSWHQALLVDAVWIRALSGPRAFDKESRT